MNSTDYSYLHGFASSPYSTKAQFFNECFLTQNIALNIPNLNGDYFSHLTLTRQLQQVASGFKGSNSVILIGSSLGGLTAAWLGQRYSQVQCLILLAPAFGFLPRWLDSLGEETVEQWQSTGYLLVYHYGQKRSLPIHYQFVLDLEEYREQQLQREIPTLILHGRKDEIIPLQNSQIYANERPWVKLVELDSDHNLTNVMPQMWEEIKDFLKFKKFFPN